MRPVLPYCFSLVELHSRSLERERKGRRWLDWLSVLASSRDKAPFISFNCVPAPILSSSSSSSSFSIYFYFGYYSWKKGMQLDHRLFSFSLLANRRGGGQ
jgi:hypothetical protein